MIVYLATYPRCGHALTRSLIRRNFGYVCSNGHPAPVQKDLGDDRLAPEPVDGFPAGLAWGDWCVLYEVEETGELRRMVRHGALPTMSPDLRERLAAEDDLFLFKTHDLPRSSYFPGESAIQMIRHPGAATASFRRMLMTFKGVSPSIEELIRVTPGINGQPGYCWSEYHEAWASARLPKLRMRYEDVFFDQPSAVRQMNAFLRLPLRQDVVLSPLEEAHASNPKRNPAAGIDGWRADFSDENLELLWELHGPLAATFGYGRETTVVGAAGEAFGVST